MNKVLISIALVCLFLSGCSGKQNLQVEAQPEASRNDPDLKMAKRLIGPTWPLEVKTRSTTEGRIYINNLNSQITAIEAQLQRRESGQLSARLALNYYHRFQILGRLGDAEQARELLRVASLKSQDSTVDLANAQVLLGFHEFDLANAAIDSAERRRAKPAAVEALRAAINRATGQMDNQPDSVAFSADSVTDPSQLVAWAAESINMGQSARASFLLKAAQDSYTDSGPYLISWIQVQQGILFLRHEDYVSAEIFFRAAHERFPEYVLATEHLAETQLALGKYANAVKLYTQVARQTANPEFYYQLSRSELALNLKQSSQMHLQMARTGYADLLQRYPTMYADHAARYYLEMGEASKALDLAEQNFSQRQDLRASTLLLETGLAAGNAGVACGQLKRIQSLGYAPPELPLLADQLKAQCGNTLF